MFYETSPSIFRATGFVRNQLSNEAVNSNHFDLNRGIDSSPSSATGGDVNSSLNTFPYERPWSISYPSNYKIPSMPRVLNPTKDFNVTVEPRYMDGDLAGFYWGQDEATGYSLMEPMEGGDAIYLSLIHI